MRLEKCWFCSSTIYPGHGIQFFRDDAKLPYVHLTPLQAAVAIVQKCLGPTIPKNAHPLIVDLLERCWEQEPSLRPEFSEIVEMLQYMAQKILQEERATKKRNLGESRHLLEIETYCPWYIGNTRRNTNGLKTEESWM